jgi:hypothetical protein
LLKDTHITNVEARIKTLGNLAWVSFILERERERERERDRKDKNRDQSVLLTI